jgi:uncharacterized membrane protein YgdD (TMEM256/DUF423 family)
MVPAPDNGWKAALLPVIGAGGACIVALAIGKLIQKTPNHPQETFSRGIWVRHFVHLRYLFSQPVLRNTAILITGYWLIANFLGLNFVQFAKEMFPDATRAGRMTATATMLFWVGGGLMIGSTFVSVLSRNKIQLPLAPIGGVGMSIGLVGVGLSTMDSLPWYLELGLHRIHEWILRSSTERLAAGQSGRSASCPCHFSAELDDFLLRDRRYWNWFSFEDARLDGVPAGACFLSSSRDRCHSSPEDGAHGCFLL